MNKTEPHLCFVREVNASNSDLSVGLKRCTEGGRSFELINQQEISVERLRARAPGARCARVLHHYEVVSCGFVPFGVRNVPELYRTSLNYRL